MYVDTVYSVYHSAVVLPVHQRSNTTTTKSSDNIATALHYDDKDSEIQLPRQQGRFSRRSGKTSQRKGLLKSQINVKIHAESGITTDRVSMSKSNKLAKASCICPEDNSISRYVAECVAWEFKFYVPKIIECHCKIIISFSHRLVKEPSSVHIIRQKEGVPLPRPNPYCTSHSDIQKKKSKSLEDMSFMVAFDRGMY